MLLNSFVWHHVFELDSRIMVSDKTVSKPEKKPMKGLDKLKCQTNTKNKAEEAASKLKKVDKSEVQMEFEETKEPKLASKAKPVKKVGKIDFSKAKPKKVTEKIVKVDKQNSPPKKPKKNELERPKIDFSDGSDEEPEQVIDSFH